MHRERYPRPWPFGARRRWPLLCAPTTTNTRPGLPIPARFRLAASSRKGTPPPSPDVPSKMPAAAWSFSPFRLLPAVPARQKERGRGVGLGVRREQSPNTGAALRGLRARRKAAPLAFTGFLLATARCCVFKRRAGDRQLGPGMVRRVPRARSSRQPSAAGASQAMPCRTHGAKWRTSSLALAAFSSSVSCAFFFFAILATYAATARRRGARKREV